MLKAPVGYTLLCTDEFKVLALADPPAAQTKMDEQTPPLKSDAICEQQGEDGGEAIWLALVNVELQGGAPLIFALNVDVPNETPSPNLFEVILKNKQNLTIDANAVVPGMPIPSQRFMSSITWEAPAVESMAWLHAWATQSNELSVFGKGIARSVAAPVDGVSIMNVAVTKSAGRRLSYQTPTLQVDFFLVVRVGEDSNQSETKLRVRFEDQSLAQQMTNFIKVEVVTAGLTPVDLKNAVLSDPVLLQPLNASTPGLVWTKSGAQQVSRITLSWLLETNADTLQAVLILMPMGFHHKIDQLSDIAVNFPVSSIDGPWAETWAGYLLRVYVNIEPGKHLQKGRYSVSFNAVVPSKMPALNVWRVSLCTSRTCDGPDHPGTALTFAIPGFTIGQKMRAISASLRPSTGTIPVIVLILVVAAALHG
jgi:hypothetical protein